MDKQEIMSLIEKTKKLKILFVEDNEVARVQALKILTNFFDTIDIAVDGAKGIEKYKAENGAYDVVISDINMPVMDGVQMSKAILESNIHQKIIIVSAYNDSEHLEELINIGINNYIHKPITIESLITEIQKIILVVEREKQEEEEVLRIKNLNHELDALINSFNTYVIASRTDLKGIITYSSKAYETISGYNLSELLGKPHRLVRHPDMPSSAFKEMWDTIKSGKLWVGEVKNLKKDGSYYWVTAHVAPYYDCKGTHIGYSSIRTDITAQKDLEKLHNEVNNLLDNAKQGFLSFDKDFNIGKSYSKECLNIFGLNDIANKNITEILFGNDTSKKELFIDGITRALDVDETMIKEMFLSLLPKEHSINDKEINIEYKALDNNMFMLILTDVTKTKILENRLKEQNQIQKMIVAVASNRNDFIELKFDFENFVANPVDDLIILLRELHTFKGVFAQKEMLHIVQGIHNLESKINSCANKINIVELVNEFGLEEFFDKDLEIISSTLGEEFLNASSKINIDVKTLDALESKVRALDSAQMNEKLADILHDFDLIKYESVYEMLTVYSIAVKQMALKLEKEMYPLEIIGDKSAVVSPKYKPFMKTLIHLFNNCIDHGIEDIETRIENGKNEMGKIVCRFSNNVEFFQIVISDDGAGINTEKLRLSAKEKGISREGEPTMLVFADSLSSKEELSTTSGRGVGMSAIKSEVDKLDGSIEIKNKIGIGVEFIFTFAQNKG